MISKKFLVSDTNIFNHMLLKNQKNEKAFNVINYWLTIRFILQNIFTLQSINSICFKTFDLIYMIILFIYFQVYTIRRKQIFGDEDIVKMYDKRTYSVSCYSQECEILYFSSQNFKQYFLQNPLRSDSVVLESKRKIEFIENLFR